MRTPEHISRAINSLNLQKTDYEITRANSNHFKIFLGKNNFVMASSTPSCPYAWRHIAGDIRRQLRKSS